MKLVVAAAATVSSFTHAISVVPTPPSLLSSRHSTNSNWRNPHISNAYVFVDVDVCEQFSVLSAFSSFLFGSFSLSYRFSDSGDERERVQKRKKRTTNIVYLLCVRVCVCLCVTSGFTCHKCFSLSLSPPLSVSLCIHAQSQMPRMCLR